MREARKKYQRITESFEQLAVIKDEDLKHEIKEDIKHNWLELRKDLDIDLLDSINDIINSEIFEMKPSLNTSELIDHLDKTYQLRFQDVGDESLLSAYLEDMGYYKFSGYRKIFMTTYDVKGREWQGTYEKEVKVIDIVNLVEMNRELCHIFYKYLRRIEKRLKQRASFFISEYYGNSVPHLNKENFEREASWIQYINKNYTELLENGKKNSDRVILHHNRKYKGKIPIWVFFDKISFGAFQHFICILKPEARRELREQIYATDKNAVNISKYVEAKRYNDIVSIIRMIRNMVMHNARIYDLEFKFKLGKKDDPMKMQFFNKFVYATPEDEDNGIIRFYGIRNIMKFFLKEPEYRKFENEVNCVINDTLALLDGKYANRVLDTMGLTNKSLDFELN